MKQRVTNRLKKVLALLLTIAAFMTGQTVLAESTWEVRQSFVNSDHSVFRIIRPNRNTKETIHFRTVSLSAFGGVHYWAKYGMHTFQVGELDFEVTVNYNTDISVDWVAFQYLEDGLDQRNYRFEVLDQTDRTLLASETVTIPHDSEPYKINGQYISKDITDLVYIDNQGEFASGMPDGKYFDLYRDDANSNEYLLVDDYGWSQAFYLFYEVYSLFLNQHVCSNQKYLRAMGAKLYATACFTMKEENDGYQYIQIATDSHDGGNDPNGQVYDPVNSFYKACFILSHTPSGSVMRDPHRQFFPHRYDHHNQEAEREAGISHSEFDYSNSYLYQQKFKEGCRASESGAIMVSPETDRISLYFDAAGTGDDNWYLRKDVFLRLAVGEAVVPTLFGDPINTAGYHRLGARETISVPFSEIVKVSDTGTTYLSTSWGRFDYEAGSGTNVLSFSGVIGGMGATPTPGTELRIMGLYNTAGNDVTAVTDLAGNAFTWPGIKNMGATVGASDDDDISDHFFFDEEGRAIISSEEKLNELATYVNGGHDCSGITFIQTDYITCGNNPNITHTPIGTSDHPFRGTYDGGGYRIGDLNISSADGSNIGLFGVIENSTVQNLWLYQPTITGKNSVGGIVGTMLASTVQNCLIEYGTIQAGADGSSHLGSIAGRAENGSTILGCASNFVHVYADTQHYSNCTRIGGILGSSNIESQSANANTIQDCCYASPYPISYAIVCEATNTIFNRAYYSNNTVGVVGGLTDGTCTGSPELVHTISLGQKVVLTGTETAYNVGKITLIGDNVMNFNFISNISYHCPDGKTVTVDYTAAPDGYDATFTANGVAFSGKSFTMPNEDVTVNATGNYIPATYSINYELKSGTNNANNPSTYTILDAVTLDDPTRTNYFFDGWYTDNSFTSAATTPHIPTGSTGDKTFYAKWLYDLKLNDTNNNNRYTLSNAISAADRNPCCVTLVGRTLYKDGNWNTLCLPFNLTLAGSQLAGAEARTLSSASLTGGTLTLNFSDPVNELVAGKPYIIKWNKAEGYDAADPATRDIHDPFFFGVRILNSTPNNDVTFSGGAFKGTYNMISYNAENTSILFLGQNNTLYYPLNGARIGAFRAYFQLADGQQARSFVLNFGDEETGIVSTTDFTDDTDRADAWYSLDGRKLDGQPTKRGLYIHGGRMVVIK